MWMLLPLYGNSNPQKGCYFFRFRIRSLNAVPRHGCSWRKLGLLFYYKETHHPDWFNNRDERRDGRNKKSLIFQVPSLLFYI